MLNRLIRHLTIGLAITGAARVQSQILVNADISLSTTWTSNNVYNLQKQIYVLPGATLTIQAGTVVASTTSVGGSLAVCRGARIYVQGTETQPVIMTSTADVATWTGGNPKTGSWREACNEWGNLTIMGKGYISANNHGGSTTNVSTPNANNVAPMEGLIAAIPNDPRVLYGGGDDDDNSGSISYLSLRYGGKVVQLNNELNGLSLGGLGRGTDIHHVEVMNNVDDGVEIWGGTVNLKYISIWNIGDDCFDVDEGWRGKAQFLLLVQGYSVDAAQGSGVGDHAFEMDGAEDSDWQPVTTASIYNATVIGQPEARGTTAWRDNARVQFRNCIFMDGGTGGVVKNDIMDGDGAHGYGFNGTLSWAATWTTPYTATSTVNAPPLPGDFYKVQTSGNLAEMKDSVFFNNTDSAAYTEATLRGVFALTNYNVREPAKSPIQAITRGPQVLKGGKVVAPVISLDPRPANDALVSAAYAPHDGFFSSAKYRGAFAPGNLWIRGWTASEAYGMTVKTPWCDLGNSLAGTYGDPVLAGSGTLVANAQTTLALSNAKENAPTALVIGDKRQDTPLFGGIIVPSLFSNPAVLPVTTDGAGKITLNFPWPAAIPAGSIFYVQAWVYDVAGPANFAASNAISANVP